MTTLADLAYRIQHANEKRSRTDRPEKVTDGPEALESISVPTDAEMLMALAEAEREIRPGLGSVTRFPTLRELCPGVTTQLGGWKPCHMQPLLSGKLPEKLKGEIDACGGHGWVPIQHDVVERVWDEMRSLGLVDFNEFTYKVKSRMIMAHDGHTVIGEPMLTSTLAAAVLVVEGESKA